MIKENYNVLGVMSGTSLDGVDIAQILLRFNNEEWSYVIEDAFTVPYSDQWVNRLKAAVGFNDIQLYDLDKEYTLLLAEYINSYIKSRQIHTLDAVCSHGHTVLHQPQNGITLQIGNLPQLAKLIYNTVVCNFRVQDVAMGGQGAPLVPIGDSILFAQYKYCLNLGGFSNISFDEGGVRVAYDICPVNTVLNHYALQLGQQYDNGGAIAANGTVHEPLLQGLNELEFYKLPYPKSLGFEFVKETVLPLIDNYDISAQDKISTFTKHAAIVIAAAIDTTKKGSLLITGGGAYNNHLINIIGHMLDEVDIVVPDDKTIQFKEALIFGLLGVLKLRNEVNVLGNVTGATHDHSSGYIFMP
jgi:anhydro-N-acetylmuramic acid kinase